LKEKESRLRKIGSKERKKMGQEKKGRKEKDGVLIAKSSNN